MKIKILLTLLNIVCLISAVSCNNGGKMPDTINQFPSIKDVPVSKWEKLSQKKIYFGHQSVGYNIIDGIKDLMKENPQIKLNIVETSDPVDFDEGILAHSRVGKNVYPKSKIDDFSQFINAGIGVKADIAALKFCYVDIGSNTNVSDILNAYDASVSILKKKYPGMTIIHFTVPLKSVQTGPKAWVKKIIGRPVGGTEDNAMRNEYNEMLIKKYSDKEPVFDLSKIEATLPDGTRSTFSMDGSDYYFLVPEYTDDGGHLNEKGRKMVAEQLLILLANLGK